MKSIHVGQYIAEKQYKEENDLQQHHRREFGIQKRSWLHTQGRTHQPQMEIFREKKNCSSTELGQTFFLCPYPLNSTAELLFAWHWHHFRYDKQSGEDFVVILTCFHSLTLSCCLCPSGAAYCLVKYHILWQIKRSTVFRHLDFLEWYLRSSELIGRLQVSLWIIWKQLTWQDGHHIP